MHEINNIKKGDELNEKCNVFNKFCLLQIQISSLTEHMRLLASVLFKRGSNSKNEMQQESHFQRNLICIFFFKIISHNYY